MTPAEKAQELIDMMLENVLAVDQYDLQLGSMNLYSAKQCALVAVDEIIKAHIHNEGVRHLKWWGEVKQELEKL